MDAKELDAKSQELDAKANEVRQRRSTQIRHRFLELKSQLAAANASHVKIVAVTKGHSAADMVAVAEAGCRYIGESYAQELHAKYPEFLNDVNSHVDIHFVGGVQRNKVRKLTTIVDVWQSIDNVKLATDVARWHTGGKVMLQVNLTEDASKRGCAPEDAPELIDQFRELGLDPIGLMGMGKPGSAEQVRPGFALLRKLVDKLELKECSMGMSGDVEVALEEGTTMLRIGTAIFGPR